MARILTKCAESSGQNKDQLVPKMDFLLKMRILDSWEKPL